MADVRNTSRKLKRTSNACIACRTSKIKCTGEEPCANCQRRRVECRFVEGVNKVIVTERFVGYPMLEHATYKTDNRAVRMDRYLRELQNRARKRQGQDTETQPDRQSIKRTSASAFGSDADIDASPSADNLTQLFTARTIWTSPFTLPSRVIKKNDSTKRNWTWLAPTSTWSFTARLKLMIAEKLQIVSHCSGPDLFDGDLYPIHWNPLPVNEHPDVSNLPSMDYALYLFNTVKFHLGHNFRLLDEANFLYHTKEFYHGDAAKEASKNRLWFVQFLLVLAFGNAFLLPVGYRSSSDNKEPPGAKFFVRAMSLMPDPTTLSRGGFVAIEVLALTGLYLYCIDHRSSAYSYVGHAIRIAQMDGMHTQLPEDELGAETVARSRDLWWTLYVLDRHISSSVGASMTLQDSDITTLLDPPGTTTQSNATLGLLVRLSHLLSYILSTIYKCSQTQLGTFLETTRSILQVLASQAQDIENIMEVKFQNSVDAMSKGTRHVTLLYHQCVIVATRPLLLSVLKERLDRLGHGPEDWQSIVAPTDGLISAGIKSAIKTLQILKDEDNLLDLDVFLPFDMEFTYGAAMHIAMAKAVFPNVTEGENENCMNDIHLILDQMIQRGNKLAAARKSELAQLEKLFQEVADRIERRGLETLTLPTSSAAVPPPSELGSEFMMAGRVDRPQDSADLAACSVPLNSVPGSPSVLAQASSLGFLDSIGISSYEFFSLVNQIGQTEGCSVLDAGAPPWDGSM
ncbi:Zn(II)2Cys6 transcription factor [Aspergillus costaricaensis CBS 115574]|uniref:Zn(II)2Cys6 transcription factor n=1 Tax=Aspergillus costaricaensis CBS 115574 TaxID=1448317 RepID=A0ACD1IH09_9EURO|nr:Zn(II)2Cys6 transcription factor [Aspergillus costaricaensis CBS 115574]RAK89325.1 Zn(II)2Cys6 transcription factor [Aspergillus costaricaensis CBS 115574]